MEKFQLNNLKHSGIGVLSTIMAGISLVTFITIIIIMRMNHLLNTSTLLLMGWLGIGSLIVSTIGFFFGIIGLFQKETFKRYSVIGIVGNGILTGIYLTFLIIGFNG
ncbi:hypothetical protein EDC19_2301 [Natranaerovirga hydrolytica]|uniref:Uncharacterized protein n=1 Tax=Natranaerovirga hydrolytica TaxID=680378 RepID=A0A4R1MFL6_9FIRM|nr:hypothetical protein [Natranaerovirga hydrolytica]TCK90532.1 hypothetical protein EDC19_2301 [Natranaerovirga hydrolytica]